LAEASESRSSCASFKVSCHRGIFIPAVAV
jgi:hypothetical protein